MKKIKNIKQKLAQLIISMANEDQKARMGNKKTDILDRENTKAMKGIVKNYGWPGKSLVGEEAAEKAWLLVQHADHDVKFQKKCLELMKKASIRGEVKKRNLAYLTDRVLVHARKKQIYGTQFYLDKNSNILKPKPLRSFKNLEHLRKRMGLGPFTKYVKFMQKVYGIKVINNKKASS